MSQPPRSDHDLLHNTYTVRLRDATRSLADSFTAIVRLTKIEQESQISSSTVAAQDTQQMQVRAANMVRSGESLMRLVADVKESLILNDFGQLNEVQADRLHLLGKLQAHTRQELMEMRDEMSAAVRTLESEITPQRKLPDRTPPS